MDHEKNEIRMTYGYARVSTDDQNADRQLIALRNAGVSDSRIYIDHKSGKDFKRPAWIKLIRILKQGDLLIITSIDRMGRCYEDITAMWRMLVKTRGVFIRVLDMPLIDTTTTHGLLSMFIADLVLQILSFVAESEREHIRTRQREGIAAAKLRGVRFGRPTKPVTDRFNEANQRFLKGEINKSEAARLCGMPLTTFSRKSVATRNVMGYSVA